MLAHSYPYTGKRTVGTVAGSGGDRDGGSVGLAGFAHADLYMLVQRDQRLHQPLQRDVQQLVAPDLRHLGLGHAGQRGNFGLIQAALVDQIIEFDG
ncbi:hypothetical protein G6F63_016230 [Rhizopus arrhizus]|nr:hypothetical protein G6F63_016230 [Rhizopus arrhizus]